MVADLRSGIVDGRGTAIGNGLGVALARLRRQLKKSPDARSYMDEALTPVVDGDLDNLEMFNNSAASRAAGDHAKKMLAKQHDHAKQHEKVG